MTIHPHSVLRPLNHNTTIHPHSDLRLLSPPQPQHDYTCTLGSETTLLPPQSQLNYTCTCTLCLSPCPSMSELRNRSVLLLWFMVPFQQLQAAVQISCWRHIRSSSLLPQVRKSEIGSQISGPSSSVEEGRRRKLREKRERGRTELREGGGEIFLIA